MELGHLVINYLIKKYGSENVAQLGNISTLKPRAAINRFAKSFKIPLWEIEEFKNTIPETVAEGDKLYGSVIENAMHSDIGKMFSKAYPQLKTVAKIENHYFLYL